MAGYKIIDQHQVTDLTGAGRFVDMMEITFETEAGSVGSVKIPLTDYTFDTAKARVEELVGHMAAVDNLGKG